jgi:hypothetical protein
VRGVKAPTITLCMIVRDEEAMLPGCFESVRELVDEIVVVDTGSVDRTRQIAEEAGAKVFERPWDNDFAAPRNLGIAHATSDWVLVLDADERLTRGACAVIRRSIKDANFDCAFLPLHNATHVDADLDAVVRGEERQAEEAFLPRLMRRTDDLRYSGLIHESVQDWLIEKRRPSQFLEGADIVHLGGVPDVRARKNKRERNVKLLERACAEHPDDPTPFSYLAHERLEQFLWDEARHVVERGWAALLAAPATLPLAVVRLSTARAWLQVRDLDPKAVRETLAVAARSVNRHPDLLFFAGAAAELEAIRTDEPDERELALDEAATQYGEALACDDPIFVQKFVLGSSSWASRARLGVVELMRGRVEQARVQLDAALASNPSAIDSQLGRIEALVATGEASTALQELEPHLGDRPDGWVLGALAAEALGEFELVRTCIAKTQAHLAVGFGAPHRRERYFDVLACLGLALRQTVRTPGPMGQLALLLDGVPDRASGARARGLRDPIVRAMVRRALRREVRTGCAERVERLFSREAEEALPGILELVAEAVGGLEAERSRG